MVLAAVLLLKPSTFGGGAAVPFAALSSVFAACVVKVLVLKALTERGKGAAVRFAAGVGSGECVLVLPALLYSAEFLVSRSHVLSVEWLAACSAAELAGAAALLWRARGPASSKAEGGRDGYPEAAPL